MAVAGYTIETPRLLLHSTSRRFPEGMGNDHDLVGRFVMVQGAPQTEGALPRGGAGLQGPASGGVDGGVL